MKWTNQRVAITVDVDDASTFVLDQVDHSTDEVLDGQSWDAGDQRSQVVCRLQLMPLESPGLAQSTDQEPVQASPGVEFAWSVQSRLALRRIDKV